MYQYDVKLIDLHIKIRLKLYITFIFLICLCVKYSNTYLQKNFIQNISFTIIFNNYCDFGSPFSHLLYFIITLLYNKYSFYIRNIEAINISLNTNIAQNTNNSIANIFLLQIRLD